MSGRTYCQSCFTLERDGVELSEGEVAQSLNQYFATVAADIPPLDTSCLPSFLPSVEEVPIVHSHVVCKKLLHVKTNKAMGSDSIPPRIIKEFAYKLTEPVAKIFNTSLSTVEVPILWKCSNIIPIPKVKQPLCESDTRPISLTPIYWVAKPSWNLGLISWFFNFYFFNIFFRVGKSLAFHSPAKWCL